jgi:hypothetical protein
VRCVQAENGLEKGLANLWSRKKITKKAHAGRGQETKWEMSGSTLRKATCESNPFFSRAAYTVRQSSAGSGGI